MSLLNLSLKGEAVQGKLTSLMNEVVFSTVASLACASLAQRMRRSANKVANNPRARDKVFKATQKVFPSLKESRKETIVNRFEKGARAGTYAAGGASLAFAIRALLKLVY